MQPDYLPKMAIAVAGENGQDAETASVMLTLWTSCETSSGIF
jgi:hypothetical protein